MVYSSLFLFDASFCLWGLGINSYISFRLMLALKYLPQWKKGQRHTENKHMPFISFLMTIWRKNLRQQEISTIKKKKKTPRSTLYPLPWQSGPEYAIVDSSKIGLTIVLSKSKLTYYSNLFMPVFLGLFLGPLLLYWCLWQGGTYIPSYNIS